MPNRLVLICIQIDSLIFAIMYVPDRLHQESNGPGWGSGGDGRCWHLIFPHTLRKSGSHLKHVLLLFGCVRFGHSGGRDTDGGFIGGDTNTRDKKKTFFVGET